MPDGRHGGHFSIGRATVKAVSDWGTELHLSMSMTAMVSGEQLGVSIDRFEGRRRRAFVQSFAVLPEPAMMKMPCQVVAIEAMFSAPVAMGAHRCGRAACGCAIGQSRTTG